MIPLRGVVLDGSAMQMAVVDEMRRASRGHSGWENLAHGMGWALGLLGPVCWDISSLLPAVNGVERVAHSRRALCQLNGKWQNWSSQLPGVC